MVISFVRIPASRMRLLTGGPACAFLLLIEVGIEDSNPRNPIDGMPVAVGGLPDRFGVGTVVDAKGLPLVIADVGMDPGHAEIRIGPDHVQARGGAIVAVSYTHL